MAKIILENDATPDESNIVEEVNEQVAETTEAETEETII